MKLTKFAYDAMLPMVRPDSVVRPMTPGLWGLFTPSSWPDREEGTLGPVIAFGDTAEELTEELTRIGTIERTSNTYSVTRVTVDKDWWVHRAEDGMIPMEILEGKV